jgi:hypothetical protein
LFGFLKTFILLLPYRNKKRSFKIVRHEIGPKILVAYCCRTEIGCVSKSTWLEKLKFQFRATEGICRAPPESFDLTVGNRKNLKALLPWISSWAGTPGEEIIPFPCEKSSRKIQFGKKELQPFLLKAPCSNTLKH